MALGDFLFSRSFQSQVVAVGGLSCQGLDPVIQMVSSSRILCICVPVV